MEIKRIKEESVEDLLRLWAHLTYLRGRDKTEHPEATKHITDEIYLRLRKLGATKPTFNTAYYLWAYEKDDEGMKEIAKEIENRPISFRK